VIKQVVSYEEFRGLRDEWDALLEKSGAGSIFLTWEWMNSWWNNFRHASELYVLVGRGADGCLTGIAPLMKRTKKVFGVTLRCIEFISSGDETTPDYLNFIMAEGCEDVFVREVLAYIEVRRDWDIISLMAVSEDGNMLSRIRSVLGKRHDYAIRSGGSCVFMELPKTWDEYVKKLSRKSRYNIMKKERDLASKCRLEFSVCDSATALNETIETLSELHRKRMLQKGISGSSITGGFWKFQKDVAGDFFAKGWLMIGLLKADGKIIACQYAYLYRNKLFHYQSGFDPAWRKYSIGLISNAHMIQESIRRGLTEYDFLRGNEDYKYHWASRARACSDIIIASRNVRAKFFMLACRGQALMQNAKSRLGRN